MDKNQLICVFGYSNKTVQTLLQIQRKYDIQSDSVLIFENVANPENIYFIFNATQIDSKKDGLQSVILHKKKQSNTYYTINALNQLIIDLNGGVLDTSYSIEWDNYPNCILLADPEMKYKVVNINLKEKVQITNY